MAGAITNTTSSVADASLTAPLKKVGTMIWLREYSIPYHSEYVSFAMTKMIV
jgi:hypothetical protein